MTNDAAFTATSTPAFNNDDIAAAVPTIVCIIADLSMIPHLFWIMGSLPPILKSLPMLLMFLLPVKDPPSPASLHSSMAIPSALPLLLPMILPALTARLLKPPMSMHSLKKHNKSSRKHPCFLKRELLSPVLLLLQLPLLPSTTTLWIGCPPQAPTHQLTMAQESLLNPPVNTMSSETFNNDSDPIFEECAGEIDFLLNSSTSALLGEFKH